MWGMIPNPYEPPSTENKPSFRDETPRDELERRIAELEGRIAKSWLLGKNILLRVIAIWAYFLLGYAMIGMVVYPIILLLDWLGFLSAPTS